MNNLEYLDLINRVIDNTATEKEKLRLQQLRDENPEVQKYYEKMTALCTILQRTPKIAPPHNFKDTIMHAIEVQGGKASGRKGIFRQLLRSFRPSPAVKYALAASGGLALGLVLYLYSGNLNDKSAAMDRSLLRGALLEPDNQETIVDKKTVSFEGAGVSGVFTTGWYDRLFSVELILNASISAEVRILYDTNGIALFSHLEQIDLTSSMNRSGNGLVLKQEGKGRHLLIFECRRSQSATMHISVKCSTIIYEDELVLNPKSE